MELKLGYRQTDVGLIPEDWDIVNLDNVCTMKSGEEITSKRIDNYSPYPCYGGNGLRGFTTRYTHDGSFALIGRQGALCGNVVPAEGQFFASEHAVVVSTRQGVDIRWLTYVLGRMHLNRHSESSAQPGLSVSKVLKLPLAFPPIESEQHAIATALSDADTLLDGLDRLIAKKRDLKQAAMQQLLTGKTRLPGFKGEWEVKLLRDLLTYERPDRYIVTSTSYSSQGDIPVLTANKAFILGYTTETSGICTDLSAIVFDDFTTDSKFATVPFKVKSSAIKILRPRNDRTILRFLFEQMQVIRFPVGEHKRHYISDYQNIKLPIPEYDEQLAVVSILSDMDAEITTLEARREKTQELKRAMMQDLLTGRIRLFEPGEPHA